MWDFHCTQWDEFLGISRNYDVLVYEMAIVISKVEKFKDVHFTVVTGIRRYWGICLKFFRNLAAGSISLSVISSIINLNILIWSLILQINMTNYQTSVLEKKEGTAPRTDWPNLAQSQFISNLIYRWVVTFQVNKSATKCKSLIWKTEWLEKIWIFCICFVHMKII